MTDKQAIRAVLKGQPIAHSVYLSLMQREMIKHVAHCGLVVTAWGLESTGINL